MSETETKENTAEATNDAEESTYTELLIEQYEAALDRDGPDAFRRWGFGMYHSISDARAWQQMKVLGLPPPGDAVTRYNDGCLLCEAEKFAEAAREFEAAIKLDPELAEAVYNHALALEKAGDKAGARASWQKFLDLCQDEEEAARVKQHLTSIA